MGEAQALVERILALQNPDGGWPHYRGTSCAEPTAFVVLALAADHTPPASSARDRAISWLLARQKAAGGWSPNENVTECTSVTAIAALALLATVSQEARASAGLDFALRWTASQIYPDDLSFALLLAKALNLPPAHAPGSVAWYPGTAGWVTPTALTAIVLLRAAHERNRPDLRTLALQSCSYLLSRRCSDQGWNHGGSKTRSEDATSYPETTGLALLALRAAGISLPDASVCLAKRFLSNPQSVEALSWLQLALSTQRNQAHDPASSPPPRTIRDMALRSIALASQSGNNPFLGSHLGEAS